MTSIEQLRCSQNRIFSCVDGLIQTIFNKTDSIGNLSDFYAHLASVFFFIKYRLFA